jgi:Zn-dependent peptidase ImmA (M78 family)
VYQAHCTKKNLSLNTKRTMMTDIELTEWQANVAAAHFLMPPEAVTFAFREVFEVAQNALLPIKYNILSEERRKRLADLFIASKRAMSIRLGGLGLRRMSLSPNTASPPLKSCVSIRSRGI